MFKFNIFKKQIKSKIKKILESIKTGDLVWVKRPLPRKEFLSKKPLKKTKK